MNHLTARRILFVTLSLTTFGCSDSYEESTTGVPGKGDISFYQATAGSEAQLIPIVGVRADDGSVFIGAFAKDCDDTADDPTTYVFTNSQNGVLDESKEYGGPSTTTGGCSYSVDFRFSSGALLASGTLNGFDNDFFDIEFSEIDEAEFYQILKAETEGKGFNYEFEDESTREQYDRVCNELSAVNACTDKF